MHYGYASLTSLDTAPGPYLWAAATLVLLTKQGDKVLAYLYEMCLRTQKQSFPHTYADCSQRRESAKRSYGSTV